MTTEELLNSNLTDEQRAAIIATCDQIRADGVRNSLSIVTSKEAAEATISKITNDHALEIKVKDDELATKNSIIQDATAVILDPDISAEDAILALKTKIDEQTLPARITAATEKVRLAQVELDILMQK